MLLHELLRGLTIYVQFFLWTSLIGLFVVAWLVYTDDPHQHDRN